MAPKMRMGLSMTKHNFCPMIKGCKSQNKATRIFVFASIYYSTYYYCTTILCLLWQKFVYTLFNFLFRLTLRWPTRLKCQNLCKRGRDQFHQSFTSFNYPFYSIFPWFSAFKMVSSVFGVHKCYFGLFSLQPLRFSLTFETLVWR